MTGRFGRKRPGPLIIREDHDALTKTREQQAMSIDTAPVLISAEELAKLMQVSERTLWRLLSAGKVPQPVRIGRNTRWRYAEIREWIEKGCTRTFQ